MKYEIVKADRAFAKALAPVMRDVDKTEVFLASGLAPEAALLESIEASDDDMCWGAVYDGRPCAMFGANSMIPEAGLGGIWLLASDDIYKNKRDFLRCCVRALDYMHTRYQYLTNFIHAENAVTIAWLEWLGFMNVKDIPEFGPGRAHFIQYLSVR